MVARGIELRADARRNDMNLRAGVEQREDLACRNLATTDDDGADRRAIENDRIRAHRNCPARGPATRNATYNTNTAANAALEYRAARGPCHPRASRPIATQVTASHAPKPQTSCGRFIW